MSLLFFIYFPCLLLASDTFSHVVKKDDSTHLHELVVRGSLASLREALCQNELKVGVNPNATTKSGMTPLHLAAAYVTADDYVKDLLVLDEDINDENLDKYDTIRVYLNNKLRNGSIKITQTNISIRTLMIKTLLAAGANPKVASTNKWTPLHVAAYWGNYEAAKVFINAGTELNAIDQDGWTPLHLVAAHGYVEIARDLFIDHADLNIANTDGYTPLHLAVYWGHYEIVQDLISAGADKYIKNNRGKTALDIAKEVSKPNHEIIQLLENGSVKK